MKLVPLGDRVVSEAVDRRGDYQIRDRDPRTVQRESRSRQR